MVLPSKIKSKFTKVTFLVKTHSCSSFIFKVVSATFLLACFLSLKESTSETTKNAFYFTSKALFALEKIKFYNFIIFKFHDVIKCLSIKQEMHFTWEVNTVS